ncbi:MAG: hypothetical protein ACLQIB_08255 [Isosphaeraceae bacterium]
MGRKYVETGVYNALKSKTYHSILSKLGKLSKTEFSRDELAADLTFDEAKKIDNFLPRLKKLTVIRPGEVAGEYAFNIRMYQVYITLKTIHAQGPASSRQGRTQGSEKIVCLTRSGLSAPPLTLWLERNYNPGSSLRSPTHGDGKRTQPDALRLRTYAEKR